MSAPTTTAEVTGFLAGVRSALADLDGAERDELLGGLEADVQEAYDQALADSGTAPGWFADPAAYAAELRASAGLPSHGAAPAAPATDAAAAAVPAGQRRPPATAELKRQWLAARDNLHSQSWWPSAVGFGRALAPVWWVVRAWLLCAALSAVSGVGYGVIPGTGPLGLLVFVAATVASVQLGRGHWRLPAPWGGKVLAGVNIACALVLTFVVFAATLAGLGLASEPDVYYETVSPSSAEARLGDGIWVAGEQVTNLFVYGPDGKLIDGAQIVDQAGRPVVLAPEGEAIYPDGEAVILTPRTNSYGVPVPNAFPVPQYREDTAVDDAGNETIVRMPYNEHPPLVAVPPLAAHSPTPGVSPSASPGVTPTVSPSASAGPSPSPSD